MPLSEVLKHDLLSCSPLFDGDALTKPNKHTLMIDLEAHLNPNEVVFLQDTHLKTTITIDFMLRMHQLSRLSSYINFGEAIKHVILRESLTLLDDKPPTLLPLDYGWYDDHGILLPVKHLKLLSPKFLSICGCEQCGTKRCKCRSAGIKCVTFCRKCEKTCENNRQSQP